MMVFNKDHFKTWIPYLLLLAGFAIVSLIYFRPVLKGDMLYQNDIALYTGYAQEINRFKADNGGKDPYWTNSSFAGMPDYAGGAEFEANYIKYLDDALRFLPRPADYLFIAMLSFVVLMAVMGMGWRKSLLGAVMFGFSSYFFIILEAGHNSKAHAIAYFPLVVAAVLLAFRNRKYLWSAVLMSVAMGLEIYANHIQMTYYLGLALAVLVVMYLYDAVRKHELSHFAKALGALSIGIVIGLGLNASRLLTNWSYQKYTIRGGSELAGEDSSKNAKGLDKEYILAWSYGKAETLNLMIPNLYGGGSSTSLDSGSNLYRALEPLAGSAQALQIARSAPTYWGPQPFTSGPAYVGAVTVFLFVLGLVIVKGRLKWWILAATLLSFFMAWGKNMAWFSDLMIDYFPLYSKFRTVSSALTIVELLMPMLATLAVWKWFYDRKDTLSSRERKNSLTAAFALTGGICLVLWIAGGAFFSFSSPSDAQMFGDYPSILRALEKDRAELLSGDALRSLLFISGAALVLLLGARGILKAHWGVVILSLLVLADLWGADRRYLNDENFVDPIRMKEPYRETLAAAAAPQILKDTSYFRVWNRAVNTMHDTSTSFYFHSIGGYSAAKLQRYQDLWDYHLSRGNMEAAHMLNVKYILDLDEENRPLLRLNSQTSGPAWFVEGISLVDSPEEEIAAIDTLDTRRWAVADSRFKPFLKDFVPLPSDSLDRIDFVSYQPNHLVYKTRNSSPRLAVFSEVYYPDGWNAYVDHRPADHFRVDYLLRAMIVPAGEHTVEFRFDPQEVRTGKALSGISFGLLLLLFGGTVFYTWKRR